MEQMIRILKCFQLCHGLKVNLPKNSFFGINVADKEVCCLANRVRCTHSKFPTIYLGLLGVGSTRRRARWNVVEGGMMRKIVRMKGKNVISKGRLTLLRSSLFSLSLYYFSLFCVPKCVLKSF